MLKNDGMGKFNSFSLKPVMTRINKDFIFGYTVARAPQRLRRPTIKSAEKCPFCPGHEGETPATLQQYPETGNWYIRCFENKFPIFDREETQTGGRQEVVVETPEHKRQFEQLDENSVQAVIRFISQRLTMAGKEKNTAWTTWFKNSGAGAGATIAHTHSQLFVLNFIPEYVDQAFNRVEAYYLQNGCCYVCDALKRQKPLLENRYYRLDVHPSGRMPYQMRIVPREHQSCFDADNDERAHALAGLLLAAVQAVKQLKKGADYNLILNNGTERYKKSYHWTLDIMPRLAHIAGLEWATGLYVQPVARQKSFDTLQKILRGRNE